MDVLDITALQVEWVHALCSILALLAGYQIVKAVYNVKWHPLSRFPGPRCFAISRIPYAYCHMRGRLATTFNTLHKIYGPIVRTAPNELSFIEPSALRTIYAERKKSCPEFRKNYDTFNETRNQISKSIFLAGHEDHTRMRKVINPAFSDRALRNQEPRIQHIVQNLITKLEEQSTKDSVIDINRWYNYLAFDIIADTTFGEPFDTLKDPTYQPWIDIIGKTWKAITFASATKSIVPPLVFLRKLLPIGYFLQKEVDKFNLILNRVKEKVALGVADQHDLLSLVIRSNGGQEQMSSDEVIANGTLFVAAGTETVTTLLSSLTYLLAKHERVVRRLTAEVRQCFSNEHQMSFQNLAQLEYLSACIQEALRLFPPIPEGLPRIVPPGGEMISGYWIPGGELRLQTFVQISPFAAARSHSNFMDPDSFVPERWLRTDPRFQTDKLEASQPFSIGPRNCVGQK
ncbi:MAG: hypothetical protein M1821_000810 [Bathelium mastoideum]|nr:MAG: hypothetical protein M1821_000810 [Bathelium mastoideum]